MNKLYTNYDFKQIEKDMIDFWHKNNLAQPDFKDGKDFTIVIPPPNVTGHLHLGHAWDGIIQDAIIRYKRLQHFNALWLPGTDHAGIATQVKFEKYLKSQNIDKNALGKEKFMEEIIKWKDQQANFIRSQWNAMGFLLDYTKEKFTLDKDCSEAVLNSFVSLYKAGLIYEGYKIVNWDSILKTAISDIEVIHKDTNSKLYYIKYDLLGKDGKVIDQLLVATTRPETMFGDTALVVNPTDERFKKYVGLEVINPVNGVKMPIVTDEYIDKDFGTGIMKCTPAHAPNDYVIAKKYNFPLINILNDDATLNENCPKEYVGLTCEDAAKKVVENLAKEGRIDHVENIVNHVGYSERTGVVIQPYITKQWFLKTSVLAKDVIKTQESNRKVNFLPPRFEATLMHWLNNMEDWCISRQLWWGHRLPIWYNNKTNEVYCNLQAPKDPENWHQSTDVLDTWYSSGLWPMEMLGWNGKEDHVPSPRYPTSVLVTGYDIIFFWIARMMMFSSYFVHESPFDYVYIHGLVLDEHHRKMSKSLGNGIEPQTIIDEYGNDAMRIFFLSDSASGEDISFKPNKLKQAFNFLIKLWSAANFNQLNNFSYDKNFKVDVTKNNAIENYMLFALQQTAKTVKTNLDKYSFNVAYKELNDFVWNTFCNFYLECMKKPQFQNEYSIHLYMYIWKYVLIMLQPYAPFLTEYLYQTQIDNASSILKQDWLKPTDYAYNEASIKDVEIGLTILNKVRQIRNDLGIAYANALVLNCESITGNELASINSILSLTNATIDNKVSLNKEQTNYVIAVQNYTFNLHISNLLMNQYKDKLCAEINKLRGEISRSETILGNEDFIKKASEDKINDEKEKYENYKQELLHLQEELNKLEIK